MGMSMHVVGFRAPDEEWKKMKEVFDACDKAGIDIPEEVIEFFNYEDPDEAGVLVELKEIGALEEWADEGRSGFQVDISKLPKRLKYIRFYNSW